MGMRMQIEKGTEQIPNGYRMATGTRVEWQRNAFCQALPLRFLLIGTVSFYIMLILLLDL